MTKKYQGLRYADSTERMCLAGALTLLTRMAVIDRQELNEAINTNGLDGLMHLLNEAYKKNVNSDGFEAY